MNSDGKQEYQAILEALPDLIFILNSEGEHIQFHSNSTEDLFVDPKDIVGKTIFELLPDEVSSIFIKNITQTLNKNKTQVFEYKLPFKGSDRYFEARMVSLGTNNVLVIIRNITERHKNQEYKLKMEKELRESHKLETIGKIVGGINHDFNNILTILEGNLRRLAGVNIPSINKHVLAAQNSVNRAKRLTKSLLSFAYKDSSEKSTIDLELFVNEFNEMIHSAPIAPNCQIELIPCNTTKKLWLDKSLLENSLINLIFNSRDAILLNDHPGHIKLRIQLKQIDKDEADDHHCLPGEYVQFSVEDNGAGIPQNLLNKVLEPLFTTKARGKGTGLGLSMAQRFVKDNDGFLKISSEVGVGTKVSMYLPTSINQNKFEQKKPLLVKCPGDKPQSICLVDDEVELLNLLTEDLKNLGYTIHPCSSPEQALDVAKTQSIDLLLTDVTMPYAINGLKLSKMIKELQPEIPIIFITGFADEDMLSKLKNMGHVILKPVDLATLSEVLADTLNKSGKSN